MDKGTANNQKRWQETEDQRQCQTGKDHDDTKYRHRQDQFPDQEVGEGLEGMLVAKRGREMGRGFIEHIARFPAALAHLALGGRIGLG